MSRIAALNLNLSGAQKLAMTIYAVLAAVLVALYAPSNAFAQDPAGEMISALQTGVLALLGAGVAIVVAVALFYAGKAFVSRIRS